jgi:4-hydroxy-3-polyprenylbenzoate decarboxylase
MYRVQLFGPRKCAMHWHMHHDGARHFRMYQKRGEKMPLAIVLGGESVLPYAATAPLPPGIEELLFAGFLNGGGSNWSLQNHRPGSARQRRDRHRRLRRSR